MTAIAKKTINLANSEMGFHMENISNKMDIQADLKPTPGIKDFATVLSNLYKYQTKPDPPIAYNWEHLRRNTEFSPEAALWVAFVIGIILLSVIAVYYITMKPDRKSYTYNQNDEESTGTENVKEAHLDRISILDMSSDNRDSARKVVLKHDFSVDSLEV